MISDQEIEEIALRVFLRLQVWNLSNQIANLEESVEKLETRLGGPIVEGSK